VQSLLPEDGGLGKQLLVHTWPLGTERTLPRNPIVYHEISEDEGCGCHEASFFFVVCVVKQHVCQVMPLLFVYRDVL